MSDFQQLCSSTSLSLCPCCQQVAWSFAKLDYFPEELLDRVTAIAEQRSAQFDGKSLANVMWALGKRGPRPGTQAMLAAVAGDTNRKAKVCVDSTKAALRHQLDGHEMLIVVPLFWMPVR